MADSKPRITIPDTEPPGDLVVEDLEVGSGDEPVAGLGLTVHSVGVARSTGEEFDSSWDRDDPLQFGFGVGQVIPGWDQGLQGMRIGGRRRITIPPHLGYGERGAGGVIKGGETLVFVVDLLAVG